MSEFDVYRRDLQQKGCERTLETFSRSPVVRGTQTAIIEQAQELHDAAIDCLESRTLDNAVGESLNVIGRIVGLYPRPFIDAGAIRYFGPDDDFTSPDNAPVYVTNAPTAGQVPVGDVEYRRRIRAKIAKNHTKYGSAPEIAAFTQALYGFPISVKPAGGGDVELIVSPSFPPAAIINELTNETDTTQSDSVYLLPLPSTARIVKVTYRDLEYFAPDESFGAPDVATVGVSRAI